MVMSGEHAVVAGPKTLWKRAALGAGSRDKLTLSPKFSPPRLNLLICLGYSPGDLSLLYLLLDNHPQKKFHAPTDETRDCSLVAH